jgi:hypothetical protein
VNKETVALHVPEDSVEAYMAAHGWKDFMRVYPTPHKPNRFQI